MTEYIRDGRAPIPKKASTSKIMSANKAKDTNPEMIFRKGLWKAGLHGYRLHPKELPGRPDISFRKPKVAIFINGCFWHHCPICNLPLPKSNTAFWKNKFDTNVSRDQRKIAALEEIGWRTLTVWECRINADLSACLEEIRQVLDDFPKAYHGHSQSNTHT